MYASTIVTIWSTFAGITFLQKPGIRKTRAKILYFGALLVKHRGQQPPTVTIWSNIAPMYIVGLLLSSMLFYMVTLDPTYVTMLFVKVPVHKSDA